MWIDLFDVDKFVSINKIQPVTNPIIFDRGNIPTPDGLLSTEIFGRTPNDRKSIFGYVDLGERFLHPVIYKDLLRLDRRFEKIISGTEYYKLNSKGELIAVDEDDEEGATGLKFLYENFEKIKMKPANGTNMRSERLSLLKGLNKDELFIGKMLICPPFYRDINSTDSDVGKISVGDINRHYQNVIRFSNSIRNDTSGLDMVGNATKNMLQKELVSIYDFFMHEIKGKNGMFRKFVLGVSVDYGARLVISSNRFEEDKYTDMVADFYHCGLPLATACANFFPFVLKWVKDLFYNEFYLKKKKTFLNAKGEIEQVEIKNPENLISDEYISKAIDSFIHSYAHRFKTVTVETDDGREMCISITGYYQDAKGGNFESSTVINRPATWTDILYMACVDVTQDKHVMITRYPIENYTNIVPNKIRVISTKDTKPAVINGKVYDRYPVVNPKMPPNIVSTQFIDTLNISNLYLKGLGSGDYDGDQVTVRGLFSQESNKQAEEILYSKKNILSTSGQNMRVTEKEAIQAIYNLTKITA